MTDKQLKQIIEKVLGYSSLGFFDWDKWNEFSEQHFTREGISQGEPYSSEVNHALSNAALYATIEEVKRRLLEILEK